MKKYGFAALAISAIIALLISNSAISKAGAINGIKLCEGVIIPSLLPILILTNIIIKSNCSKVFEKLFGAITEKAFKLPRCTAPAIMLGLISGYPAGAILTNELLVQGMIDEKTASRIMRFNLSGGIAFIITAIGQARLHSLNIGIVIYLSCIIPAILIGIINGIFIKEAPNSSKAFCNSLSLNEALISSVESATKSIIAMSAYIILFSSISSLLPSLSLLSPILEITTGIYANELSLEYISFFLAFGGLCVHLQIIGTIKIKYLDFLLFRLINAISSFAMIKLYQIIFPIQESVFSNQASTTVALTQANTGFGIIMILGCAVIVFDIENRKMKLR